jgi:ectoine hydroxylase-related dioxygenase (phytanoyl-CoA dioxygenase family)
LKISSKHGVRVFLLPLLMLLLEHNTTTVYYKHRASSDFHAGDILVFSAYLMHAPLTNTTDRLRFSTDTRYQLASQPQDMRHMGPIPDEFNRQQRRRLRSPVCCQGYDLACQTTRPRGGLAPV